jgi:hypothetical protein
VNDFVFFFVRYVPPTAITTLGGGCPIEISRETGRLLMKTAILTLAVVLLATSTSHALGRRFERRVEAVFAEAFSPFYMALEEANAKLAARAETENSEAAPAPVFAEVAPAAPPASAPACQPESKRRRFFKQCLKAGAKYAVDRWSKPQETPR